MSHQTEAPRRKRLRPVHLGLVLLAGLGLGALLWHWPPAPTVLRLPNGDELHVEGVTWGPAQAWRQEPSFVTALRRRLNRRWPRAIGPGFEREPATTPPRDAGAHLWTRLIRPASGATIPRGGGEVVEAIDAEGRATHASAAMTLVAGYYAERYDALDWRSKRLAFRFSAGGQTQEFTIPNPRRGERYPVWRPRPLPQTNAGSGFEFVLQRIEPAVAADGRRSFTARVEVSKRGARSDGLFELEPWFADPTGNRSREAVAPSEPVWRVELAAYPRVTSLTNGRRRFRLGQGAVPGDGQHTLLAPEAAATNAGVQFALVAGAGRYQFNNPPAGGAPLAGLAAPLSPISASPLAPGERADELGYGVGAGFGCLQLGFGKERPSLWVILHGDSGGTDLMTPYDSGRLRLAVQLRDGEERLLFPVLRNSPTPLFGGRDQVQIYSLDLPPDVGPGQLAPSVLLVEPIEVAFTIPAPGAQGR